MAEDIDIAPEEGAAQESAETNGMRRAAPEEAGAEISVAQKSDPSCGSSGGEGEAASAEVATESVPSEEALSEANSSETETACDAVGAGISRQEDAGERGSEKAKKSTLPPKSALKRKRSKESFAERMGNAGYSIGRQYDAIKNSFFSYRSGGKKPKRVKSRLTRDGETFIVGRKTVGKIRVVGGKLRLYLALDPQKYNVNKYHHKDYTGVAKYANYPFMIRITSKRKIKYALELIADVMANNGYECDPDYIGTDQAHVFTKYKRRPVRSKDGGAVDAEGVVVPLIVPAGGERMARAEPVGESTLAFGDFDEAEDDEAEAVEEADGDDAEEADEFDDDEDDFEEAAFAEYAEAEETEETEAEGGVTDEGTPEAERPTEAEAEVGAEEPQLEEPAAETACETAVVSEEAPVREETPAVAVYTGSARAVAETLEHAPSAEPANLPQGVRLPVGATVVNKKGVKIGKIKKRVWYDGEGEIVGEFADDDDKHVYFVRKNKRSGYVDKNHNVLTFDNRYLATVRYSHWWLFLILALLLAAIVALTSLVAVYYLGTTDDTVPTLFVADESGEEWNGNENLPVFFNEKFGDSVIQPGQEGAYRFSIENKNAKQLIYNLVFSCENPYEIGLVYRLKRDGAYIAGTGDYISVDELLCESLTIEATSSSVFELEWRWKDSDEVDTNAGENQAQYILHIQFTAWLKEG